jgi:uncharacterized protein YndB with AHSA1/START domain
MATSVDLRLDLNRVFPIEPVRLYRFFADGPMLARWWGPRGFSVGEVDFDPYPGSRYRIEMRPPDGDAFHLSGTFRRVAPADRLAFTFRWEPPDPEDVETLAELSFRDFGNFSELVLTQGAFKTEERRELHRQGWAESLDKLERLVTLHGAG